ncbi:MAG TPA: J domain-containing protein [Sphingopyxis sp.]|nr:J domain-containing protein [Sphingopyxis sp.]
MTSPRTDRFHGRVSRDAACAVPGCEDRGEFRAPLSHHPHSDGPPAYRWMCLDHVRQFNSGYNYFAGMDADQISAAQSPTSGWETESRAFRPAGSADLPPRWADFKDPMDALGSGFRARMKEARQAAADPRFSREEHRALSLMDLPTDMDRTMLRRRYAELLRQYHPDKNGGDRRFEKRLAEVVSAYQLLKSSQALASASP